MRRQVPAAYSHTCAACGVPEGEAKLEIDHVIPVHKGGITHPDNLQPLCQTCHAAKTKADQNPRRPIRGHKKNSLANVLNRIR